MAAWASAQAMKLLPTPVGPLRSRLWWDSTQPAWARLRTRPRSRPRGTRKSRSSTLAGWRRRAALRRVARRRLSRTATSRSTSRPSRSSKLSSWYWLCSKLLAQGLGHAGQAHQAELRDGLVDQHGSGLDAVVVGAAHVLVLE